MEEKAEGKREVTLKLVYAFCFTLIGSCCCSPPPSFVPFLPLVSRLDPFCPDLSCFHPALPKIAQDFPYHFKLSLRQTAPIGCEHFTLGCNSCLSGSLGLCQWVQQNTYNRVQFFRNSIGIHPLYQLLSLSVQRGELPYAPSRYGS